MRCPRIAGCAREGSCLGASRLDQAVLSLLRLAAERDGKDVQSQ